MENKHRHDGDPNGPEHDANQPPTRRRPILDAEPPDLPDTEPPAARPTSPADRSHNLTPADPTTPRHPIADRTPLPSRPIPTELAPARNRPHIPRRDKITTEPQADVDSCITRTTPTRHDPKITRSGDHARNRDQITRFRSLSPKKIGARLGAGTSRKRLAG
jgi:hypothetical protein